MNHLLTLCAGARIEEFLYEKLDRKAPSRLTTGELLGQHMRDAAKEFGPGTPYGEYKTTRNKRTFSESVPVLQR